MSVSDRLAQVSASSRHSKEHPSDCLSPPLSLSSPIIKKKPIQIPSFDEKGLIYEKHSAQQTNTDRSFVPICSSKTSSRPSWSKSCHYSQKNLGERASTLPRTKPQTYGSPTLSAKPRISISPAPKPNSSPTLSTLAPKPSDSPHLPASLLSDPSSLLHQPPPRTSVSPTLTVPTPRLSPSPTSLSRGTSLDSRGGRQPSPVAKERQARSITISNSKVEPESHKQRSSNEAKHDILDQEALLDTSPALRRACPQETYSEYQTQAAMSQNSCSLQGKVGLSQKENIAKDKPKPPPRNIDVTAIPKPKSNIEQQQEFLPSGATGTQAPLFESKGIAFANVVQRESQSAFEGLATQSSLNLHRRRIDLPQSRTHAQTAGFASKTQSYEQMYSERSAPKMSFATEPLFNHSALSPNTETRRRRFGLNNKTKLDSTFLPGSNLRRPEEEINLRTITENSSKLFNQTGASNQNIKQKFWSKARSQTTQTDVKSAVGRSDCVSKDYSCQSKDSDQIIEVPQYVHRLNPLRTCLVIPQSQEASRPAPVEGTTSKTTSSQPDIMSHKRPLDHHQSLGQNKSHRGLNLSDTGLNQTDIFAPSDRHGVSTKPPEYSSGKCIVSWPSSVEHCPFSTNSFGFSSKWVFDRQSQQQQRVPQRPDETTATTTASPPLHQPNPSASDRAFIMEEPEDPYYVTMYYPGSVYVGE